MRPYEPIIPMRILAPAKINLSLSVCGRRQDGYHLLNSLVGFLDFADELNLEPSDRSSLQIKGAAPTSDPKDNIVMKTMAALEPLGVSPQQITLTKNIPTGAGLGGGSADAAAILRALGQEIPKDILQKIALQLGADVPVCYFNRPARMEGIGEVISPIPDFPISHLLLVALPKKLETHLIFAQQDTIQFSNHPTDPLHPDGWHNNLENAACQLYPPLEQLLKNLRNSPENIAAGMSGSGVCCFAAYPDETSQKNAEKYFKQLYPKGKVIAAKLLRRHDV